MTKPKKKKRDKEYPYKKTRRKNAKIKEVPEAAESDKEGIWQEERD